MIENVGVHTVQFPHPIISRRTPKKHDNSCFQNFMPTLAKQWRPFGKKYFAFAFGKKYFARSSVGELKNGGSFHLIG